MCAQFRSMAGRKKKSSKNRIFLIVLSVILGGGVATFVFLKKPVEAPTTIISADSNDPVVKEQKSVPKKKTLSKFKPSKKPAYVRDEQPTPQFVKAHVAKLSSVLSTQIRGAELTLEVNKNVEERAEIQRRLQMARKFQDKLNSVDPNDKRTWFFLNDPDPLKNNFLEIDKTKK